MPDRPWVMRTYAGHSSPAESNALFQRNLEKGQTGLSIAFDLPTQIGYDPDDPLARGEVGKVGVPVAHLGDMRALLAELPLGEISTSMTINATAMYLLALYQVVAEERSIPLTSLQGTVQNDLVKEFLSRGTHIFPPAPSLRLTTDLITYSVSHLPRWNPVNICSYHLQEAGATPVQEVAFSLATARTILDELRPRLSDSDFLSAAERISFFVNAGVRFIEEMCKMRAFTRLWDELLLSYGVTEERARRFRYGVQVNSLSLTALQPENNVPRITLEALGVTLSKSARARALQLPAWNEALGLPRPWDQQWSLRIQQVLAFESDLLEYEDIFEGSHVIEAKVAEICQGVQAELSRIEEQGGLVSALESGYMKDSLVSSHAARRARLESGEDTVVGVNAFTSTEPSPLLVDLDAAIQRPHPAAEADALASLSSWREERSSTAVEEALSSLRRAALGEENLFPSTLTCVQAGVTVGEWASTLREVFGTFRPPTGMNATAPPLRSLEALRTKVKAVQEELGHPLRLLMAKPGLDGHSNGAEQIALRARDAGFEVIYQGIRLTPEQIASAAVEEDVSALGLSILSGSHMDLVPEVLRLLHSKGADDIPIIVGGIIPDEDAARLCAQGVAAVFTPKDTDITAMVERIVDVARAAELSA